LENQSVSKIVHFFVFFGLFPLFFFTLAIQIYENGRYGRDWGHCESTLSHPFFTNSKVDMVGFVDLHKVVVRRSAFSTIPSAWMEVNQKVGQKVKGWNTNFHKSKRIWIYKKSLNWFPFHIKENQGKNRLWWKDENEEGEKTRKK
jgi:hypothetical protein